MGDSPITPISFRRNNCYILHICAGDFFYDRSYRYRQHRRYSNGAGRGGGITVVPLTVFFGDDAYLDGIELDNLAFLSKIAGPIKILPTTSQPSPAKFQEAYTRLIEEGADGILSIHLSSHLSGTYQSARTASESLPDDLKKVPIEVIDSLTISAGMSRAVFHGGAGGP